MFGIGMILFFIHAAGISKLMAMSVAIQAQLKVYLDILLILTIIVLCRVSGSL